MASKKRAADRQITKDDADEEESTEMGGTWQEAAPEKLAKRHIAKARRRGEKKEGGAAASEEKPAATMPVFDFTGGAAKAAEGAKEEEEKKAEAPKAGLAADNPLARFLKKEGQWECPGCMLTNQPDKAKCVACETPNPKAAASGASNAAEDSVAAAGITFGAAPAADGAASSGLDKPLFSWAGGESAAAGAGTLAPPATEGGFSFGFNIASSGPISFGGVAAAEGEGFKAPEAEAETAAAATAGAAGEGKEEAKPFQLEAKPDVSAEFKDKKAESTGEEGDTIELKVHARVFQLKLVAPKAGQELPKRDEEGEEGKSGSAAANKPEEAKAEAAAPADATPKPKFVEAGSGELHLNTYEKDGKKARLVLRVDKTQRLVLNAAVFPGMTWTHGKEDKSVRLVSTDLDGKMGATWALKFKTKDDASTFAEKLGDVISSLQDDQDDE